MTIDGEESSIMAGLRTCMFCGATSSLSDEHVIPKWLLAEIKAAGYPLPANRPSSKVTSRTPDGPTTQERLLSPHGILINKRVCGGCNEGWMGRGLETEFSPVFKRLVRMQLDQIKHPAVKELMVRWAVKTCMVHDETVGGGLNYTQDDRTMMMHGGIPANTDVHMTMLEDGAYTGVDSAVMDLGNVRGDQVLGTLEVLYAGPMAFLIRRAAQGNEFLNLLSETQYFAQEWIPLHTFMPQSTALKQLMSAAGISAFLDTRTTFRASQQ